MGYIRDLITKNMVPPPTPLGPPHPHGGPPGPHGGPPGPHGGPPGPHGGPPPPHGGPPPPKPDTPFTVAYSDLKSIDDTLINDLSPLETDVKLGLRFSLGF
ncbi:hypothetical protein NQ315_000358, partial [Exocentrus adspersus]